VDIVQDARASPLYPAVLYLAEDCLSYPWRSGRAYRGLDD
jgi:hypothetical protein